MNISIFGTGYVGLVTGACLADVGHNVICMDVDPVKIEKLKTAELPIWEPGLEAMVRQNLIEGRLQFTTDAGHAVQHGPVQIIAVGTPSDEDGSADMQHVTAVVESIAREMQEYKVIIIKSTVPVGTTDMTQNEVSRVLAEREITILFDVVANPEFLKEGDAVKDFLKPDRIIVGTNSPRAQALVRKLYEPFNRNHQRIMFMDARSAELTKYAANAMLATKISFINEIANLSERLGADIEEVRKGIGADTRIGYHFIYPGCGYGGSCFPKDVKAIIQTAQKHGYNAKLIKAVEEINEAQKTTLFSKVAKHFGGAEKLAGKTIAVWGLAFKPNTDDMREAPSRHLIEALLSYGAVVQAYDPVAMEEAERIYGKKAAFKLCSDKFAALKEADALVICTEWQQFRSPNIDEMALNMRRKIIVDGRNLYQPLMLQSNGWTYISVGRRPISGTDQYSQTNYKK